MPEPPLVSIIIPHLAGKRLLKNCLSSLEKTGYQNKEVILVDNASTDGSVEYAKDAFPGIEVVRNEHNLGYAGGCNAGLGISRGDYVLFLNNDTEISERDWLSSLVDACEKDTRIAACQPKLRSLRNRSEFDYAGAAGGLLDIFGFPFALGRLFFSVERDEGQYDVSGEIFWACGTAMFTRKSALEEVGKFDEDFFAHVEEIDLCWRFHLAGYRVISVPKAVVYHNAGSTLTTDSYLKVMLNHRNSLVMLLKNLSWKSLIWIFPIRILLEFVAIFYSLAKVDFVRFRAVLVSLGHIILNFKKIILKRKHFHRIRRISEKQLLQKMYRRSIVFDYFIKGIQKAQELKRL